MLIVLINGISDAYCSSVNYNKILVPINLNKYRRYNIFHKFTIYQWSELQLTRYHFNRYYIILFYRPFCYFVRIRLHSYFCRAHCFRRLLCRFSLLVFTTSSESELSWCYHRLYANFHIVHGVILLKHFTQCEQLTYVADSV